ncbi:MAG: electron transfer flavoprotein subunit alpha, partial [Desulfobacteraceae bacterium]|nr:electron transfer flavoprotein subunit alpha [Desulfobacteraceae bacterium]
FSGHTGVWVFIEQNDGVLANVGLELLGKARELGATLNETVSAVLVGRSVEKFCDTLANHGAENIYLVEDNLLAGYRTIAYANVMEKMVKKFKPSILLIGATPLGRDLAPRVSRRVGSGLTADCTELTIDEDQKIPDRKILWQTRPAFGGNVMATIANRYSRPQMATVRTGVMEKTIVNEVNAEIIRFSPQLNEMDIKTR